MRSYTVCLGFAVIILAVDLIAGLSTLTLMQAGVINLGPPPWWLFAPLPFAVIFTFLGGALFYFTET